METKKKRRLVLLALVVAFFATVIFKEREIEMELIDARTYNNEDSFSSTYCINVTNFEYLTLLFGENEENSKNGLDILDSADYKNFDFKNYSIVISFSRIIEKGSYALSQLKYSDRFYLIPHFELSNKRFNNIIFFYKIKRRDFFCDPDG